MSLSNVLIYMPRVVYVVFINENPNGFYEYSPRNELVDNNQTKL